MVEAQAEVMALVEVMAMEWAVTAMEAAVVAEEAEEAAVVEALGIPAAETALRTTRMPCTSTCCSAPPRNIPCTIRRTW